MSMQTRVKKLEKSLGHGGDLPPCIIIQFEDAEPDESPLVRYETLAMGTISGREYDRLPDESEEDFTSRVINAEKSLLNYPMGIPLLIAKTEKLLQSEEPEVIG